MTELEDKLGTEDVKGKCPECKELTTFMSGYEVSCEDCGEHAAVECQNCGERFDHVWGYDRIVEENT